MGSADMNKTRRRFIAEVTAIAGIAAFDGFGLMRTSSALQANSQQNTNEPSRDIRDYSHVTDVIKSKDIVTHFPLLVSACSDYKGVYLSQIPFLIELEVCKIWKESLFEWDAISNVGAGGLQQLMEATARGDIGLTIVSSTEIKELNTAVTEYTKILKDISAKRQSLYTLVESGSGNLTQSAITKINALRSEMDDLETQKDSALKRLKSAKSSYSDKIHSIKREELKDFDARFVPELAIPGGMKYLADIILECKEYFGGPIEMNVWRGVAAYNCGLQRAKDWDGMPFIRETVLYTRDILFNLTKMMELKYAYSTGDSTLIAKTKRKFGV
jgi:hypothetical protein